MSVLFIICAAFFNALMDALENSPNYNESVFRDWDGTFWCKDVSWKHARKVFSYKIDGWHLSKSMMIIFLLLAIVFYKPWLGMFYDLLIMGGLWNVWFYVFYHRIFRVK